MLLILLWYVTTALFIRKAWCGTSSVIDNLSMELVLLGYIVAVANTN